MFLIYVLSFHGGIASDAKLFQLRVLAVKKILSDRTLYSL
jgi:hypothetical protein